MTKMYKNSGVDLQEAEKLNNLLLKKTDNNNIGKFSGSIVLSASNLRLVSTCDGIGTKIIPLLQSKMYNTIAVDLIAANLNDLITQNARAVSFMDYISVHKLDSLAASEIISEINSELKKYNCLLTGGETSEMPDLLKENCIDICGFVIGVSDNSIYSDAVECGDVIIGLKSNGIHANGFSLIRKLHNEKKLSNEDFEQTLAPSYIYYNEIAVLWDRNLIKTAANITGGGIVSNLKRIIPQDLALSLNFQNIPSQDIFNKLYNIIGSEIYEIFNCGTGFCVISKENNISEIMKLCKKYEPFILGKVIKK